MNASEKALREQLLHLLRGGNAHITFDDAIARFPPGLRGIKPPGAPHTAWQLLEHMRIAQWDILEFSRDPKHVSPKWPDEYWLATEVPPDKTAWSRSVASFKKDLAAMERLVKNPSTNLYRRLPHGTGQNILREALLVADHNAYHLGQMILLSRLI
jgi:hypothetical protein